MRGRRETRNEILRSLLILGIIPLVVAGMFAYVWLGQQVRHTARELDQTRRQEFELRSKYNYLLSRKKQLYRPDNLARLAREKLNLVPPEPEPWQVIIRR